MGLILTQSLSKINTGKKRPTKIVQNTLTEGVFHKSELTGRITARPVILTVKNAFFQEFLMKNHLFCESYLGFHWSGWIVLIKSEILIMTGMVWPVSSDKWKAPCVWSSSIVSDCDLITVTWRKILTWGSKNISPVGSCQVGLSPLNLM